ncbi:MAG: hypothetical protein ACREQI_13635 [Candidatus Binataceae bacterium]
MTKPRSFAAPVFTAIALVRVTVAGAPGADIADIPWTESNRWTRHPDKAGVVRFLNGFRRCGSNIPLSDMPPEDVPVFSWVEPEARLAGKEAKLRYVGHLPMDNRHGLAVNTRLTQPVGTAEPPAGCARLAIVEWPGPVGCSPAPPRPQSGKNAQRGARAALR